MAADPTRGAFAANRAGRTNGKWRVATAASALTVILIASLSLSCDNSSTGPAAGGSLPLAFAVNLAGGAAAAFDRADAISVRATRDGQPILNQVLPFASKGADVRIRLPVDASLEGAALAIAVEIRAGQQPLFSGTGTVIAGAGGDPTEIALRPVIAAIEPPADRRISAIGATLELRAAAVFATGDTVPDASISYQLLDQGVIRLSGGVATADREGTARVRASAGAVSVDFEVEVRIAAASVVVEPSQSIIGIGATLQLRARVFDAGGVELVRTPVWASANGAVATVDGTGLVLGVAPGTVAITASVDDVSGVSRVEVSATPPPAAPTALAASESGTTISLSWADNATNETAYEVHRGPQGGTLSRIATLPPNAQAYVDNTLAPDQIVEYAVLACNGALCTGTMPITARTVPVAPTGLTILSQDPQTLVFRLGWKDNSVAELVFEVRVFDPQLGQFVKVADVPADGTEYQGTSSPASTERYEVRACNGAGCSAPTNPVTITTTLAPPLAVTLPTVTNTELVGATDGWGQLHDWFFEYYSDPTFVDAATTPQNSSIAGGQHVEPLFDILHSNETVYYRMVAINSAGIAFGSAQVLKAPELEVDAPSTSTVCNQGAMCSSNPSTITFSAYSTGPIGAYPNPFQVVDFSLDVPPYTPLGSASVTVVDDPIDGVRAWIYKLTWDPSTAPVSPGNYTVVVRGYPGSSSGNVISSPIIFTITSS